MGEPEQIGKILQRVLAELERKYQELTGARSTDSCGVDALTIDPAAPSLSGRENQSEHFQG